MGLTVTRTPGQQILLQVVPGTTAEQLLEELEGGIMITLVEYRSAGLRINIQAPRCLGIGRTEGVPVEEF
jgi:hypothetical protein